MFVFQLRQSLFSTRVELAAAHDTISLLGAQLSQKKVTQSHSRWSHAHTRAMSRVPLAAGNPSQSISRADRLNAAVCCDCNVREGDGPAEHFEDG